jgi:hypothetical protein
MLLAKYYLQKHFATKCPQVAKCFLKIPLGFTISLLSAPKMRVLAFTCSFLWRIVLLLSTPQMLVEGTTAPVFGLRQGDTVRVSDHAAVQREMIRELNEKLKEANERTSYLEGEVTARGGNIVDGKSSIGPTIKVGKLRKQTKPYFCTPDISNSTAWVEKREAMMKANLFNGAERSGDWGTEEPVVPTYWCNKLSNNIAPWVKPKLSTDDLVVGIFTGESLFHGRAAATRDTWLLWFKHHYIFSANSDPRIPVIGLSGDLQ